MLRNELWSVPSESIWIWAQGKTSLEAFLEWVGEGIPQDAGIGYTSSVLLIQRKENNRINLLKNKKAYPGTFLVVQWLRH